MAINNTVDYAGGSAPVAPNPGPNLSTTYRNGQLVSFTPASQEAVDAGEPSSPNFNSNYTPNNDTFSGFNPPGASSVSNFTQTATTGTYANPISVSSIAGIPKGTNQYYSVGGETYAPGSTDTQAAPTSYSSTAATNNNNQIQTQVLGSQTQTPNMSTASTSLTSSSYLSSSSSQTSSSSSDTTGTTSDPGTYQLSNGAYYSYNGTNNPPPAGSQFVSSQTNLDLAQFDINTYENNSLAEAQITSLNNGLNSFNGAIGSILSGSFPLNPYQQSVVGSMQNVFSATMQIAQQNVQSYTSYINNMGARTGGQYSPGQTAGFVAAAANWGATQLSYIGAQQGQAIAQVQQGFMKDDFDMVQSAFSQFLATNNAQTSIIQNLHSLTLQANQNTIADNISINSLNQANYTQEVDPLTQSSYLYNPKTGVGFWLTGSNAGQPLSVSSNGTISSGSSSSSTTPPLDDPSAPGPAWLGNPTTVGGAPLVGVPGGQAWYAGVTAALSGTPGGATPTQLVNTTRQLASTISTSADPQQAGAEFLYKTAVSNGTISADQAQQVSDAQTNLQYIQQVQNAITAYDEAHPGGTNVVTGTLNNMLAKLGTGTDTTSNNLRAALTTFYLHYGHGQFGARFTSTEMNLLGQFLPTNTNTDDMNAADISQLSEGLQNNNEEIVSKGVGQDAYNTFQDGFNSFLNSTVSSTSGSTDLNAIYNSVMGGGTQTNQGGTSTDSSTIQTSVGTINGNF